jgi:hypothetical protein
MNPEYPTIDHPILPQDLSRFHAISRLIEDELEEGYFVARHRYGADVAGALLVFALRQKFNDQPNSWPPPSDLIDKVNDFLAKNDLCAPYII